MAFSLRAGQACMGACAAVTLGVYTRPGGLLHDIERGVPIGDAQTAQRGPQ